MFSLNLLDVLYVSVGFYVGVVYDVVLLSTSFLFTSLYYSSLLPNSLHFSSLLSTPLHSTSLHFTFLPLLFTPLYLALLLFTTLHFSPLLITSPDFSPLFFTYFAFSSLIYTSFTSLHSSSPLTTAVFYPPSPSTSLHLLSQPVASASIGAVLKDVLAKCYGGDISRKKKLLQKQVMQCNKT
jgi:hypothetical protein